MNEKESKSGVGFIGLLTILFIALKLTNHISWSWVWVLSPLWITAVFVVVVAIIVTLLGYRRNK